MSENVMNSVKKDWLYLKNIENQTPEVCLDIVNDDGLALGYVREQSPEICLAAVNRHGSAVEYVHDNMLNKHEHYVFVSRVTKDVYVNKINGEWLFSVGFNNNMTKDCFIDMIYSLNSGLDKDSYKEIYLKFLEKF